MWKALLLILILGLTAGCTAAAQTASAGDPTVEQSSASDATPAASSASSAEYACEPTTGSLEVNATLADHAGRYHLTLVADSSRAAADSNGTFRRAVSGLLTLRKLARNTDPAGSADSTDRSSDPSTPLYGFTDVEPELVGAHRVGDPGSMDPTAPGVLVLEREEYGRRVITLRLGSDANRKDLVRYDGTYTALSVSRIDEEGFAGSWRSGGGLGFSVTTGYFCARKVP
ncbi:MAG: hypothetical protein OXU48_03990 [candidate division Zixibacteria bacterium]|nr:hypothetical protein [candidate division Zixibacteria bacterium]